jgi:hypothetical protein
MKLGEENMKKMYVISLFIYEQDEVMAIWITACLANIK